MAPQLTYSLSRAGDTRVSLGVVSPQLASVLRYAQDLATQDACTYFVTASNGNTWRVKADSVFALPTASGSL